jgi:hypothetical protein
LNNNSNNAMAKSLVVRSSVVSVLISLISDTKVIDLHDINLISLGCGANVVACYLGSASVALVSHYLLGRRSPPSPMGRPDVI